MIQDGDAHGLSAEQIDSAALAIANVMRSKHDMKPLEAMDYRLPADREVREFAVAALRAHGLLSEGAPSEEQIEAAAKAMCAARTCEWGMWSLHTVQRQDVHRMHARAALVAASGVAPQEPHVADEAVQKLRGLGLSGTEIRERLKHATMLATAPVSAELLEVVLKIAASARITSEELFQMERRGIRVCLPRRAAPVAVDPEASK